MVRTGFLDDSMALRNQAKEEWCFIILLNLSSSYSDVYCEMVFSFVRTNIMLALTRHLVLLVLML
jgi:hypothetical protein